MSQIDRHALVDRHRVVQTTLDPRSPVSVGNGELGYTVDITGTQTFPERYPAGSRDGSAPGTLLGTQSQWGWHTIPADPGYELSDVTVDYETPRGSVPYVDMAGTIGKGGDRTDSEAELWLRSNPHRLNLAHIGLVELSAEGWEPLQFEDVRDVHQELDVWQGLVTSRFVWKGHDVLVETACHPRADVLGVRVTSTAVEAGRLGMQFNFPYGSGSWHNASDWERPERHTTVCTPQEDAWLLSRTVDETAYSLTLRREEEAELAQGGPHFFRLSRKAPSMDMVAAFARGTVPQPTFGFEEIRRASAQHWRAFWQDGAAVSFDGSTDSRAHELERRVVLSQYLTAINCSGSLPPQETGLVCNSWRGKFHLEMHWWHAAHFPVWGRPDLLRSSLGWYVDVLDQARATAERQGYSGVRWPKQVGPEARESPSPIGTFLIWQQPHPIYLAELLYRRSPTQSILEEFAEVVFQTAEFMADFAEPSENGYQLGPPVVPAQESYGSIRARAKNPTFELVYWHWALDVAQRWRERRGEDRLPHWDEVSNNLTPPMVRDGVYAAIDVEPYTIRADHPSMLCALGMLPLTKYIHPATMRATLDDVLRDWGWETTWGWDYPVLAMTAARLGDAHAAVGALTMSETKNLFLPNGHNRQTDSLPLYLPGNGGLLAAVALMAGGWEGSEGHAPGFPDDGSWVVQAEGLTPLP